MLGRISRWLRLLGYDVKYCNDTSDDDLLKIAGEENRTLLTRDLELFRRANANGLTAFYAESENKIERLNKITRRFGIELKVDLSTSRCPICGSVLRNVERDMVLDKVRSGTLKHYKKFWICEGCSKVYWRGRHWKKINETLNKAKMLTEKHLHNSF